MESTTATGEGESGARGALSRDDADGDFSARQREMQATWREQQAMLFERWQANQGRVRGTQ